MAEPATKTEISPAATPGRGFDDQKRSFLRMVSHELRTPLNSILGFSDILASEMYGPLGDPHYREYAEIIRGSGARLLKLVNQVLEIARLEVGGTEMCPRPEPVEAALEDAWLGVAEEAAARGICIVIAPACAEAVVSADPRALRTVLGNLLHNAVAFSPDGGEVCVGVETAGSDLDIVIADAGEGVDPADLPRLMRPFEQGENPLTRRGHGAGLGLAISALNCQAMGGRLELISAVGEGMTAKVRLPAA
ncbi:sensor histidine kinase [Phenylobacterium sp.]|jgi:signal transduction histidine kinase|uniref:sensor histidine kinase n=1 Tax=Phenylobacterium sp. TaxID=1871053 RepID=UPI00378472FA